MRLLAILIIGGTMQIYFLQKRLDKKVVYWDNVGRPTDMITFAAHTNVSIPLGHQHPVAFPSIIDWVARLRKNGFTGIIQPIIVFDAFERTVDVGAIYTAVASYLTIAKTIGESDVKDLFDFRIPEMNIREIVQEEYLKRDDDTYF